MTLITKTGAEAIIESSDGKYIISADQNLVMVGIDTFQKFVSMCKDNLEQFNKPIDNIVSGMNADEIMKASDDLSMVGDFDDDDNLIEALAAQTTENGFIFIKVWDAETKEVFTLEVKVEGVTDCSVNN